MADEKKTQSYFRSYEFAGLRVSDGKGGFERFTAYYDEYKGDKIKVGFLVTENPAVIKNCQADPNVEELDEKEYKLAIEGDGKRNPALQKAPVAAV